MLIDTRKRARRVGTDVAKRLIRYCSIVQAIRSSLCPFALLHRDSWPAAVAALGIGRFLLGRWLCERGRHIGQKRQHRGVLHQRRIGGTNGRRNEGELGVMYRREEMVRRLEVEEEPGKASEWPAELVPPAVHTDSALLSVAFTPQCILEDGRCLNGGVTL